MLDSKAEIVGGGGPDRTADPRLMSPLLCQLSYTATPKKLASYNVGVKEDSRTEPVFVPRKCSRSILKIRRPHNMVAVEYGLCLVPSDLHGHAFRHAEVDHITDGGSPEIMLQHPTSPT